MLTIQSLFITILSHQIGQQRIRVVAACPMGELSTRLGILLLLGSQL